MEKHNPLQGFKLNVSSRLEELSKAIDFAEQLLSSELDYGDRAVLDSQEKRNSDARMLGRCYESFSEKPVEDQVADLVSKRIYQDVEIIYTLLDQLEAGQPDIKDELGPIRDATSALFKEAEENVDLYFHSDTSKEYLKIETTKEDFIHRIEKPFEELREALKELQEKYPTLPSTTHAKAGADTENRTVEEKPREIEIQ